MSLFSLLSFKVILSYAVNWHLGSLWQLGHRGNLAKELLFGVGFVYAHLSTVLCLYSHSPGQPRLIKPLKPCLVWLSLLTV